MVRFCRVPFGYFLLTVLLFCTVGCPRPKPRPKKLGVVSAPRLERGPHGAPVAYWSDDCLLEVCIDRAAKEAKVYVLKSKLSGPKPLETPSITLQLGQVDPPVGRWPATGSRQHFANIPKDEFILIKEFATDYTKLERRSVRLGDKTTTAK